MLIRGHFKNSALWGKDWRIVDAPLVFLDIETTGLHPERGQQILEVAIIDRGGIRFHREAHVAKGIPFCESEERILLNEVFALLDGVIIGGHNVLFDLRFLAARAERLHISVPEMAFVDILHLARKFGSFESTDYRLAAVAKSLGVVVSGELHRAVPDARLAQDVFRKLVARQKFETLEDVNIRRFSSRID